MDFCEIRLQDGHFEFFLVVGRGTSRVVHLEGCEGYRAETALQAVYRLLVRNGFPAPRVRFLQMVGVEPVICPPRRPDKKPYVERCVRTFKQEWLDRFSLDTLADCYEALEVFLQYHNAQRLHMGRACQGRTPDEAFPQLPTLPRLPEVVNPNAWLKTQQAVLVQLDAQQRGLQIMLDGKPFPKVLPLKELPSDQLDLHNYLQVLLQEAISIAFHRHRLWMQSGDTP
ncbi:MAG: transposase [Chloroflexi bacterium]|nr:transposase [Chloroflexota bacterium]